VGRFFVTQSGLRAESLIIKSVLPFHSKQLKRRGKRTRIPKPPPPAQPTKRREIGRDLRRCNECKTSQRTHGLWRVMDNMGGMLMMQTEKRERLSGRGEWGRGSEGWIASFKPGGATESSSRGRGGVGDG
jgi:hypothetical protein